jgi:hypothetical protein
MVHVLPCDGKDAALSLHSAISPLPYRLYISVFAYWNGLRIYIPDHCLFW